MLLSNSPTATRLGPCSSLPPLWQNVGASHFIVTRCCWSLRTVQWPLVWSRWLPGTKVKTAHLSNTSDGNVISDRVPHKIFSQRVLQFLCQRKLLALTCLTAGGMIDDFKEILASKLLIALPSGCEGFFLSCLLGLVNSGFRLYVRCWMPHFPP